MTLSSGEIYKQLSSPRYQSVKSIHELSDSLIITTTLSSPDLAQKRNIKLDSTLVFSKIKLSLEKKTAFLPADLTCYGESLSPSGTICARLRTVNDKRYVEIVGGNSFNSYEVTKTHGNFYTDDYFTRISWAQDEQKIVYVVSASKPEDNSVMAYISKFRDLITMPIQVKDILVNRQPC
jgi:acylaminoacyl-peptidase